MANVPLSTKPFWMVSEQERKQLLNDLLQIKQSGSSLDSAHAYLRAKGISPDGILPSLSPQRFPVQDVTRMIPGREHARRLLSGAYSEALAGIPESPLVQEKIPSLAVNLQPTSSVGLQLAEAVGRGTGFVLGAPGKVGARLGLWGLGKVPIMANLLQKTGLVGRMARSAAGGVGAGGMLGMGRSLGESPSEMGASTAQEGLYMGALGALPTPLIANRFLRAGVTGAEMGAGSVGIQTLASAAGMGQAPSFGEATRQTVIGALQNLPVAILEGKGARIKQTPIVAGPTSVPAIVEKGKFYKFQNGYAGKVLSIDAAGNASIAYVSEAGKPVKVNQSSGKLLPPEATMGAEEFTPIVPKKPSPPKKQSEGPVIDTIEGGEIVSGEGEGGEVIKGIKVRTEGKKVSTKKPVSPLGRGSGKGSRPPASREPDDINLGRTEVW